MPGGGIRQSIYYILLLYALCSLVSIGGTSITLYLAFLLALIYSFRSSLKIHAEDKGLIVVALLFLVALALTVPFSTDPLFSAKRVVANVTRFIPLFLALFFVDDSRKLKTIIAMLALSTLLTDAYAFWQRYQGFDRVYSFINQPVVFATLLLVIIPVLTVVGLEERAWSWRWRAGLMATVLLSIVVLVLTSTRGAWIALAVTYIIYAILALRHNRKATVTITLILVLFCSALYSFTVLNDRVQSIFDKGFVSNTERILMWKSAWEMFLDHPLAGVGLGQYSDMDRIFYWQPQYQELIHVHAHSMYFSFLSETGLIGITAIGFFFGYILYSTYRKYRADPRDYWSLAMMLTTIAFLIGAFTEYSFGHLLILRLYLFVLGLSWVGSRLRHSIDSGGRNIA